MKDQFRKLKTAEEILQYFADLASGKVKPRRLVVVREGDHHWWIEEEKAGISRERLAELVRLGEPYDDIVEASRPTGKPIKK